MAVDTAYPLLRERHRKANIDALARLFDLQRSDVKARLAEGVPTLLAASWDGRLAELLFDRNKDTATEVGRRVARALDGAFDPDLMDDWLRVNADFGARNINDSTRSSLDGVADVDEVDGVFDEATTSGAARNAAAMVTTAASFGAQDAAKAADGAAKMWVVNSNNPRSAHAGMAGQVVPMYRDFSNGMAWPGDPSGGADNNANCRCSLAFL